MLDQYSSQQGEIITIKEDQKNLYTEVYPIHRSLQRKLTWDLGTGLELETKI